MEIRAVTAPVDDSSKERNCGVARVARRPAPGGRRSSVTLFGNMTASPWFWDTLNSRSAAST
jgi:hypothetical protein